MDTTNVWVTRDGRQLPVATLDDAHLDNIVRMGMRGLAKKFRDEALECLAGGAGGDDGTQYFAELQCDEMMGRASNPRELLCYLARTRRYGAVVREVQVRAKRKKAAPAAHTAIH